MQRSPTSAPSCLDTIHSACKSFIAATWLAFALLAASAHDVAAQNALTQEIVSLEQVEAGGTAYYTLVRSGEVRIEVLALGSLRSPGIYAIGFGMTLDELLALTGGTNVNTRSSTERIRVMLRLFRQEEGQRKLVYEVPLEQILAGKGESPILHDGDILVVETIVRPKIITMERTLRFISAAGTLFLVVLRIMEASN